jgi:hypothetical protein
MIVFLTVFDLHQTCQLGQKICPKLEKYPNGTVFANYNLRPMFRQHFLWIFFMDFCGFLWVLYKLLLAFFLSLLVFRLYERGKR